MKTSRISSKGQITIPKEIRKTIGAKPGDMIAYEVEKGIVILRRVEPFDAVFHAALYNRPRRRRFACCLYDPL